MSVFDSEGRVVGEQLLLYCLQLLEFFLFVRRLFCRVLNQRVLRSMVMRNYEPETTYNLAINGPVSVVSSEHVI